MRRIRILAAMVGALLVAAACSGDDDDDGGAADPESDPATEAEALGDPDGTDPLSPLPDDVALPIVFVHGFAGSAQQYESQAMRFVANGYPQERIVAYDHDGAGLDIPAYTEGQADLPGQSHVEVATSAESFAMQYEFLLGEEPEVVDIVPQRDPVEISGRAVSFPANTGRDGASLDIWEIDPATGHRIADEPHAALELGADGAFGPVELATGAHYEYLLTAPSSPVQHHLYLQPYVRSSHLVRLLSSEPDGATRSNTNVGDDHPAD